MGWGGGGGAKFPSPDSQAFGNWLTCIQAYLLVAIQMLLQSIKGKAKSQASS